MAAFSCGMEALMLGSLTMFASGVLANWPSSARASWVFWSSGRTSENTAKIRPLNEMSRVSTSTPALPAKA